MYNFLCFFEEWGVAPHPSYFFVLIQKSNQKKSRLQIILGLMFFGLPTQYNSSHQGVTQTVLLHQATTASLKTISLSQNSLRPFKSTFLFKSIPLLLIKYFIYCTNNREVRGQTGKGVNRILFFGAGNGLVQ